MCCVAADFFFRFFSFRFVVFPLYFYSYSPAVVLISFRTSFPNAKKNPGIPRIGRFGVGCNSFLLLFCEAGLFGI